MKEEDLLCRVDKQLSFCAPSLGRGLHLEGTLPVKEFCMFHYLREFDVDNANFTGAPDRQISVPMLHCNN